ncbi:Chloride intracellular channel exl-1 [Brachionus plicatilis]|uniref:Chloride intracellular channel exl-1 n=1 Tax=Brachionus plicatilis TaxID=10195 RepID=A0A3M7RS68_BRAPC|nr:Chloride intracellular channel exl-1 [Brachionus plicatilis]
MKQLSNSQAFIKPRANEYQKLDFFKFSPYCSFNFPIANKVELIDTSHKKDSTASILSSYSEPKSYINQLVMSSNTEIDCNKLHLFVKAGQDGRSQGACPFCQTVFLQLLVKAKTNKFNFDVLTINVDNPPKEFKELSLKPPVLLHGSSKLLEPDSENDAVILSDVDEIAEYLDSLYPNTPLIQDNTRAKSVSLNVFSKFSHFIRDVATKPTGLETELEKIDNFLKNLFNNDLNKVQFMNGNNQMNLVDCSLLPKLQHIRVAGESIKQFRIPDKFKFLWKYLKVSYETDSFFKSCPPDREIICHWSKSFLSQKHLLQIVQEAPYKTLAIPDDIKF